MREFAFTLYLRTEGESAVVAIGSALEAGGFRTAPVNGKQAASGTDGGLRLERGQGGQRFWLDRLDGPAAALVAADVEHCFKVDRVAIEGCAGLRVGLDGPNGDPVAMLKSLTRLAETLSGNAVAVQWGGANTLMSADYFRQVARIWLDGGAFPGLGLAALARRGDSMVSIGLDLLVGQEIAVRPQAAEFASEQARLAVRVMDFLVREGPVHVTQALEVEGFDRILFEIDASKAQINLKR